jgi:hypothetical protein
MMWCGRHVRSDRRRFVAPRFDERAQDGEGKIGMVTFDCLIEPIRQFALVRQCGAPFAIVIDKAADLPLRQFQIDQRQRRIGPGTRFYQVVNACCLAGRVLCGTAAAGRRMMSEMNSAVTV